MFEAIGFYIWLIAGFFFFLVLVISVLGCINLAKMADGITDGLELKKPWREAK